MRLKRMFFAVVCIALGLVNIDRARGQEEEEWEKLRSKILQQDLRIEELSERLDEYEKKRPSWIDTFTFKGDFRYRFENIDRQDRPSRNRNRFRARFFVGARVNDMLDSGFQLASGDDDPISSNQSFGEGWSSKPVRIDLAYFDFHPIENDWRVNLVGGKMKTPFAVMSKTELLWDPDIRPEGMVVNVATGLGDRFSFFGHAGGFYMEERSTAADARMVGGQAGLVIEMTKNSSLTAGAGYYDYGQLEGSPVLFDELDGFGNSTIDGPDVKPDWTLGAGDGNPDFLIYDEDYDQLELFVEYAVTVTDHPVSLFGNYVNNLAASNDNQGWLAGFKLGQTKDPGSWAFRFQHKKLLRDAAVGAFTDSDFGGGGTDVKGFEFNVELMAARDLKLVVSYFLNEIGISDPHTAGTDYDRLQVDLKFVF